MATLCFFLYMEEEDQFLAAGHAWNNFIWDIIIEQTPTICFFTPVCFCGENHGERSWTRKLSGSWTQKLSLVAFDWPRDWRVPGAIPNIAFFIHFPNPQRNRSENKKILLRFLLWSRFTCHNYLLLKDSCRCCECSMMFLRDHWNFGGMGLCPLWHNNPLKKKGRIREWDPNLNRRPSSIALAKLEFNSWFELSYNFVEVRR